MACFLSTEANKLADDIFGSSSDDDDEGSIGSLAQFIVNDDDEIEDSDYSGSSALTEENRYRSRTSKNMRGIGYTSDDDGGGEDDDNSAAVDGWAARDVETPVVKKRGRPPSAGSKAGQKRAALKKAKSGSADAILGNEDDELPGAERFPVFNYSITITKPGGDVGSQVLDLVDSFMKSHCLQGGAATEVGKRAHRFHLQCLMRMKYPSSKIYIKKIQAHLKSLLPGKGVGYKVFAKPLAPSQTFKAMLGYILKDEGEPWFQVRFFNVKR